MKAVAILERSKGIVKHRGVLLNNGNVLHNTPDKGEYLSSYYEFAAGKKVTHIDIPEHLQPASAYRILKVISNPRGYSFFAHNCQHTANEVAFGTRSSEYVTSALFILAAAVLLYGMKARR